jgi:hypothetical protein
MPDWLVIGLVVTFAIAFPLALLVLWLLEARATRMNSMEAILGLLRRKPSQGMPRLKAALDDRLQDANLSQDVRTCATLILTLIKDLGDPLLLAQEPRCADPVLTRPLADLLVQLDRALKRTERGKLKRTERGKLKRTEQGKMYEILTNVYLLFKDRHPAYRWSIETPRSDEAEAGFRERLRDLIGGLESGEIQEHGLSQFLEDAIPQRDSGDQDGVPAPYMLALVYVRHARRTFWKSAGTVELSETTDLASYHNLMRMLVDAIDERRYDLAFRYVSDDFARSSAEVGTHYGEMPGDAAPPPTPGHSPDLTGAG